MAHRLTVDVLADQLVASVKGRMLYILPHANNAARWLAWDGKVWRIVSLDVVRGLAQDFAAEYRTRPGLTPREVRMLESLDLPAQLAALLKQSPHICVYVPDLDVPAPTPHRPGPKVGVRG